MDIQNYMQQLGRQARLASRAIARADSASKNTALRAIAAAIRRESSALLAANREDLAAARAAGLEAAMLDRLKRAGLRCAILTRKALEQMMTENPTIAAKLMLAVSMRIARRLRKTAEKLKLYVKLTQAMEQEIAQRTAT